MQEPIVPHVFYTGIPTFEEANRYDLFHLDNIVPLPCITRTSQSEQRIFKDDNSDVGLVAPIKSWQAPRDGMNVFQVP